ncbi:uncharacterized protein LOC126868982 [Bombus huntii]|uniref:uncharacterized protein LOC126868982 n=1 Tax=Bombus huntii TaxID=85661 RepID=UPI0021AAE564|nr:uncharacterized protein LOC126868982 [Bombus huntii]
MDRWKRLRRGLPVLSPRFPSSSSSYDSSKSCLVGRRLHGQPRDVSRRPQSCLYGFCGDASVRSWGIDSPSIISRQHSSNLRRNRISRTSSGSRGSRPPNLSVFLVCVLLPDPSGQRKRRDADQGCGGGGGGGPIIVPVGAPGAFSFAPLVEVMPTSCPSPSLLSSLAALSVHCLVSRSTVSWRRLTSLSRIPSQVCDVLLFLIVGRSASFTVACLSTGLILVSSLRVSSPPSAPSQILEAAAATVAPRRRFRCRYPSPSPFYRESAVARSPDPPRTRPRASAATVGAFPSESVSPRLIENTVCLYEFQQNCSGLQWTTKGEGSAMNYYDKL